MPGETPPILVPLDGSSNAENAVPMAVFMANAYEAPLHFVHVAVSSETHSDQFDPAQAAAVFSSYVTELMSDRPVAAGFRASLLTGKPASAIVDAASGSAEHPAARAMVIATHGIGGLKSTLIGSVADKVIRSTTVPTLVVPGIGPAAQPSSNPVVVGMDGSELAERGLEHARSLAGKLGAKVILVRACQVPVSTGYQFAYYYPPDLLTELEEAARDYLGKVARPGELTLVTTGTAVTGILGAAKQEDASAVVVTTQGRGFFSRVALGSTTATLMHSLERPLLVVPVGA